jgi:hypothetical protein
MRIFPESKCYLLQTFQPPSEKVNVGAIPAHRVFGGGQLGLNSKQWEIIEFLGVPVYMGAAEYEGGALNIAFHNMALMRQDGQLSTFVFTLSPMERKLHYLRQSHMRRGAERKMLPPAKTVPVFVIAPTGAEAKVEEMIRSLMSHQFGGNCKRDPHVVEGFDKLGDDIDARYCGWLDVQHDFLFFADEEMYKRACQLFDLPPVETPRIEQIDVKKLKKKELAELAVRLGVISVKSHAAKIGVEQLREMVAQ